MLFLLLCDGYIRDTTNTRFTMCGKRQQSLPCNDSSDFRSLKFHLYRKANAYRETRDSYHEGLI